MENIKFENYGKNIDDLDFVEKDFFGDLDLIISESSIDIEINDFTDQELQNIFEFSQEDECLISITNSKLPVLMASATEINELVFSAALNSFGTRRTKATRKVSVTRKWDSTCYWNGDPKQGCVKHSAGDKFAATYLFFSQSDLNDILTSVHHDRLQFMKTLVNYTFDNLNCLHDLMMQVNEMLSYGKQFMYKINTESKVLNNIYHKLLNLVTEAIYTSDMINTAKCTYICSYLINSINHTINMLRAMIMNVLGKCGDFDLVIVLNSYAFNSISFKNLKDNCYTTNITNSWYGEHFDRVSTLNSIKSLLHITANVRYDMLQDLYDIEDNIADNSTEEED